MKLYMVAASYKTGGVEQVAITSVIAENKQDVIGSMSGELYMATGGRIGNMMFVCAEIDEKLIESYLDQNGYVIISKEGESGS